MARGTSSQIDPRIVGGLDALATVLEPARLRVLRVTVVICLLIATGNLVSAIFGFTTSRQVTGPAIELGTVWCLVWLVAALFAKATAQVFRRWQATAVLLAATTALTAGLTGGVGSPLLATTIYAGWIASVVIPPRPAMLMSAAISLALLIGYVLAAESVSEIVAKDRRYDAAVNVALPLIAGLVGVLIACVTNAVFNGLRAHLNGVRAGRPATTPGLTALLAGDPVVADAEAEMRHLLELPAAAPPHRRRMVPGTPLTGTEREIVRLLADGKTPKQIAHLRGVTLDTVRSQLKRAKKKTGAKTLAELARYADA